MKTFLSQLFDFFHPFHEPKKFLKVRPLIVGDILRRVDFNGLLNGRLASPLEVSLGEQVQRLVRRCIRF